MAFPPEVQEAIDEVLDIIMKVEKGINFRLLDFWEPINLFFIKGSLSMIKEGKVKPGTVSFDMFASRVIKGLKFLARDLWSLGYTKEAGELYRAIRLLAERWGFSYL